MNSTIYQADLILTESMSPDAQFQNIKTRLEYLLLDLKKFEFFKRTSDINNFAIDVERLASFVSILSNFYINGSIKLTIPASTKILYKTELINHLTSELTGIQCDLQKFDILANIDSIRTEEIIRKLVLDIVALIPYAKELIKDKSKSLDELPSTLTETMDHESELFPQVTAEVN